MAETDDGPGRYVVLNKAVVTYDKKFTGDESVMAKMDVGQIVNVVEVEECAEESRLRARLEQPAGWMSLINTETGRRWAKRAFVGPKGNKLSRDWADVEGRCDTCGETFLEGTLVLSCLQSHRYTCPRCVAACSDWKAFTFQATAAVDEEALGFEYDVLTPLRVLIRNVEVESWADRNGVKVGDELLAANGVRVDKMEAEELTNLFQNVRPLTFTFVWDAHQVPRSPGSVKPKPGQPQMLDDRPMRAPTWGVTRAQCKDLLRQLRKDPSWSARNSMEQLVTEHIVPRTKGTGLGYALWLNRHQPKEVNVVVTYAWHHNAENCLETILRSTYHSDVLFIAALALYQAQDDAGPAIEEQLGSCPTVGPFNETFTHIAKKGGKGRCCWRHQGIVRALPSLLLGVAAALLWAPVVIWGCVPSHDFERCAARTHPDGGWTESVVWAWQGSYVQDGVQSLCRILYFVAAGLLVCAATLWITIQVCFPYNGRLVAVPCQEDKMCGRLWSIYFIHVAQQLKVPAFLANSLASLGRPSAKEARCEVVAHQRKLRRLVEEAGSEEPNSGYAVVDRAVARLRRQRRWAVCQTAFGWAALLSLLQSADLRMVVNEPVRWDSSTCAFALAVLGSWVGVSVCALAASGMLWRPGGRQRRWVLFAVPVLPLILGAASLVVLLLVDRLRVAPFDEGSMFLDLFTDQAFRHSSCTSVTCQRIVAFVASVGQTLVVGGVSLTVFVLGTLTCPRLLKRWQCAAALVLGLVLLAAAFGFFFARSLQSGEDYPEAEFWHAIVVFHLVQLLSRFAVPFGALCAFALRWGWPPRAKQMVRKGDEVVDAGHAGEGASPRSPASVGNLGEAPSPSKIPDDVPEREATGEIRPGGWIIDNPCFPLAAS